MPPVSAALATRRYGSGGWSISGGLYRGRWLICIDVRSRTMRFMQVWAISYSLALSSSTSVVENTALNDARAVVTTMARIAMAISISISVKPAARRWLVENPMYLRYRLACTRYDFGMALCLRRSTIKSEIRNPKSAIILLFPLQAIGG